MSRTPASKGSPGPNPVPWDTAVRVPRWLPAVLFAALTLVLFREFVFGDGMLFGSDTLNLGYVARAFYADQLRAGSFPGWAPQILGGTPFLEALSGGDSLYPTSLLLLVMEPFRALGWKLVLHVFLAGLFMYGWMRALGVSKPAALLSGTAFMLAPFLVSLVRPGHDGKIFVTALTPLMFWVAERHCVRPRVGTVSAVALVVGLILLTTHFQMAYFLFGAVGAYALFRSVQVGMGGDAGGGQHVPGDRRGAGTRFVLFLTAALMGLGAAAVQFVPAVGYATEYSRRTQTTGQAAGDAGAEWSSSWSLHPEEVMSLVIPEFAGNGARGSAWTSDTYWGRNFLKDNSEYGGILVLLLAGVSFVSRARRGIRWFLTGMAGVALLFALGAHTPVWGLFYAWVPGIRLFRSPSMAMFLFGFAAATLAGFGLDGILRAAHDDDEGAWRRILKVMWSGSAILVVLALLAGSGALIAAWVSVVYPDAGPDALQRLSALEPYLVRGAWVAAAMGLAAAGLTWLARARRMAPAGLAAALIVMVAVDEMRIDADFVQVIDFQAWSAPDPNMEALLRLEPPDGEPYRLLSFVDRAQDVRPALYGIELAAGHHPNDLARYRELIGMVGSDLPRNLFNPNIERLLNVRYLLWPDRNGQGPPEDSVVSRTWAGDQPYETLHARPGLPRARLVASVVVKPEDEQVAYMLSDAFQPETEVVLSEPLPVPLDGGPVEGTVAWQERTPNRLRLAVTSDRDAVLVLADNWFPAWHATVNGVEVPVLRAYHALRAVPVPAGTHAVEMVYRAPALARNLWISLAFSSLLIVGMAWGWVQERR
ncbi:MAG TPA: hypothetical protein VLA36_03575 [Longimicrobiales bacterium]|nr:hypothetical protein [Longimicrobiales bacterium]